MKAKVFNKAGERESSIVLPSQFNEDYRPGVIRRAFLANMSQNYQAHGTDENAGMRHVTELSKRRQKYRGVYGAGRSRTPKKVTARRGSQFNYVGDKAPNTRKGRAAHPPLVEKNVKEKINNKERLLAIRSGIKATSMKELAKDRNHGVSEELNLPIIIKGIQGISKSREVVQLLKKLGLEEELERTRERKIRAGKGSKRGRKYKTKKGPLFITEGDTPLINASKNLPGVEAIPVENLNVTLLAPGGNPGRLTIWTKEAVQALKDNGLFQGDEV